MQNKKNQIGVVLYEDETNAQYPLARDNRRAYFKETHYNKAKATQVFNRAKFGSYTDILNVEKALQNNSEKPSFEVNTNTQSVITFPHERQKQKSALEAKQRTKSYDKSRIHGVKAQSNSTIPVKNKKVSPMVKATVQITRPQKLAVEGELEILR